MLKVKKKKKKKKKTYHKKKANKKQHCVDSIVKSSRNFRLYVTSCYIAPLIYSVKIMADAYKKAFKIMKFYLRNRSAPAVNC